MTGHLPSKPVSDVISFQPLKSLLLPFTWPAVKRKTFTRTSQRISRSSARFNQALEIFEILIDPMRDGAAETRGQLQGNARALVRKRCEINNARSEVMGSAIVGKSSPGEFPIGHPQHDLEQSFMHLSVEGE